jgi:hypothetical protein
MQNSAKGTGWTLRIDNAGRLFTDATFREIAVQAYLEKHQGDKDIQ